MGRKNLRTEMSKISKILTFPDFKIGNLFPITKDNLKRTYNRLFETDNLEANKNKTESIQALMTVAPK